MWAVDTLVEAIREIRTTKPPIEMSGIFDEDGAPLDSRSTVVVKLGARFRVIQSKPIQVSREKRETDAAPVVLVLEVEDQKDWKIVK